MTCSEARRFQEEGEWVVNPNPLTRRILKRVFRASYVVYWRPDGVLNHQDPDGDRAVVIPCYGVADATP